MQVLSDRVRPWEGSFRDPKLNMEFFAGRTSSAEMFEHGKKVFERAFKMVDIAVSSAEKSGDKELVRKAKELKKIWEESSKKGVTVSGMDDLNRALGKTTRLSTTEAFTALSDGIKAGNVRMAAHGLQGVLDPYAREIWGFGGEGVNQIDTLTEESKQYSNKSEAILKAPLWRRGLEYLWQAFGRIPLMPNDTETQLNTLRDTINDIYSREEKGDGEIANWFRDYSHRAFVAHVLSKARETGSIGGMKTTIDNAMDNPQNYSSYTWKQTESEVVEHFKAHAKEIGEKIKLVVDRTDPRLTELNYASIELTKSLNGMRSKISKSSEVNKTLEEYHKSFEETARKLGMNLHYITNAEGYDYERYEAEEALNHLREYFRKDLLSSSSQIFKTNKEIDDLLDKMQVSFMETYGKRKEMFKRLLRAETPETSLEEKSAPVLW